MFRKVIQLMTNVYNGNEIMKEKYLLISSLSTTFVVRGGKYVINK